MSNNKRTKGVMCLYEVEKISAGLINEAVGFFASDIHLVPVDQAWLIQLRINGKLHDFKQVPLILGDRLMGHLKYTCGMDIGERRLPQSNSMTIEVKQRLYNLRLSTLPTRSKESLAIRILPQSSAQPLSTLPVLYSNRSTLNNMTALPYGLCLIAGPTGSGKTTTLYALLDDILLKHHKKIITIEDPVERSLHSLIQIETNEKAGISFEVGLMAALRHDPDVLMIGEIRDAASAKLAVRAALTGHLVFATIHANNNYSALLRLREFGVSAHDIKEALQSVVMQYLVNVKSSEKDEGVYFGDVRINKRAALYTFDNRWHIHQMIESGHTRKLNTLPHQARKAWALGFIDQEELERGWKG
jgi:competence protein ComGA